jgi:hypothetical protein
MPIAAANPTAIELESDVLFWRLPVFCIPNLIMDEALAVVPQRALLRRAHLGHSAQTSSKSLGERSAMPGIVAP